MKAIWSRINCLEIKVSKKNRIFIAVMVLLCMLLGGGIWILAGRFLFPQAEWFLCFMGYPAVLVGFFGGVLYLYNHEFD